jgi:hypothetical protein
VVHVICDSCGCVGIRIRGARAGSALHPAYVLNREYHCSICGSRLRIAGLKEYHDAVMHGAEVGA